MNAGLGGSIIILEGLQGVGKTTLANTMAKTLMDTLGLVCCIFEEYVHEEMLALYLSDISRYSFAYQMLMAREKRRILQDAVQYCINTGGVAIVDRGLLGDACFAQVQRESGYLNDREWSVYQSIVSLDDRLIPTNVQVCTVYLTCSVETAMRRIQLRDRKAERNTDPRYLRKLKAAHDHAFPHSLHPMIVRYPYDVDMSPEMLMQLSKGLWMDLNETMVNGYNETRNDKSPWRTSKPTKQGVYA